MIVYPERVEYIRATSLPHSVELLAEYEGDAQLLAGGQSLIPLLKARLATPGVLVDISHITPETPIDIRDDTITIHALTTHQEVAQHAGLLRTIDLLGDAIPHLADAQVRTMGTVGGALAAADPGGDWGPVVIALDGTIHTLGPDGRRTIPAPEFFTGPFETVLGPSDVIESVTIPREHDTVGSAYYKVERRAGLYALASVGVHLGLESDGRCRTIGIAGNSVAADYVHPVRTERFFLECHPTHEVIDQAITELETELDTVPSGQESAAYKHALFIALFTRAVDTAVRRAHGETVQVDPRIPVSPTEHAT